MWGVASGGNPVKEVRPGQQPGAPEVEVDDQVTQAVPEGAQPDDANAAVPTNAQTPPGPYTGVPARTAGPSGQPNAYPSWSTSADDAPTTQVQPSGPLPDGPSATQPLT